MTTAIAPRTVARIHRSLDMLHSLVYFAPEAGEEYKAAGLDRTRYHYFAGRAAAMGPVPAEVVIATFYNFSPTAIRQAIPRAWQLASCDDILAARLRAVDRAYRRLLGDEGIGSAEVAEAAELARAATDDLPAEGRPLFGGHAALPWPDEPHLVLWQAITVLREFRGDGHVGALLTSGLSGLEALVSHTATGRGFTEGGAKLTRGWTEDEWAGAVEALRARGLLNADGLTDGGLALRDSVEQATDRLGAAPWVRLGEQRAERLRELGAELTRRVVAAGAFPQELFASTLG